MSGTMVVERTIAVGTILVWPVDTFGLNAGVGADGPLQHHDTANKAAKIMNWQQLAWPRPAVRNKSLISSIIGPHALSNSPPVLRPGFWLTRWRPTSGVNAAIPLNFNVHPFA